MRRRRRKKNPGPALLLLGGAAAALASAGLGVAIFGKKKSAPVLAGSTGQQFASQPAFTTGLKDATGILVGDCIVAVQGQAGFAVPGSVPNGENTLLKVTASGGPGATLVQAFSIDPRVTPAGLAVNVPTAAISGSGDCT